MVKIRGCTTDGIMAMGSRYDILQRGIRGHNYQCEWLRGDGVRTEFYMLRFLSLQMLCRIFFFALHPGMIIVNNQIDA